MSARLSKDLKQLITNNSRRLPFPARSELHLEFYPQTELPPPHLRQAGSRQRRDLPGSFGIDVPVWLAEIHLIKGIEQLCPELRVYSLRDLQSLAQRRIQTEEARSIERVECDVSKCPNRRTLPRSAGAAVRIEDIRGGCRCSAAVP